MKVMLELSPGYDGVIQLCSTISWTGPTHRHDELELNLVVQGSAICVIGGRRHVLGPNCLLWIFPGQEHMLARESTDFKMWVAVFRRSQVRRIARVLNFPLLAKFRPIGHFCRIVDSNASSLLSQFMETMLQHRERNFLPHFNTSLDWLLMEAWRRFDSSSDLPVNADIHPAVQRLTAILREDASTLDEMARRVGMSPTWLSRLFQSQMKISIPAYRSRQRLNAFLLLYKKGGYRTLTQSALEAGFQSYVQFYRVFTNLMGVSPRQFAASVRENSQGRAAFPKEDVPPPARLRGAMGKVYRK
jgi:AraC-like DNA-binding protein